MRRYVDMAGRVLERRALDRKHRTEAEAGRRRIEAAWPSHALDAGQKKEIGAYAKRRLGSAVYAPWLETYATWRGDFVEGWIPDNYAARHVVPYSNARRKYRIGVTIGRRLVGEDVFPDAG